MFLSTIKGEGIGFHDLQERAECIGFFGGVTLLVFKVLWVRCAVVIFVVIMGGVTSIGLQISRPPTLDRDRYYDVLHAWWTLRASHTAEAMQLQNFLDTTVVPISVYSYGDHRFIPESVRKVPSSAVYYPGSWLA
eukprot:1464057-Pyramimonas_sp.AAC.1